MEWDNNTSLALIDEYRKHPMLWDPKDIHYFSKNKKHHAWEQIAQKINSDVLEVKQKMNSLLSSFRREKYRGKRRLETGFGNEVYVSKWYAFERMQFLLDRGNSDSKVPPADEDDYTTLEQESINIKQEDEDHSNDIGAMFNSDEPLTNSTDMNEPYPQSPSFRKRKREWSTNEDKILETFKIIKQSLSIISDGDDHCSKFAQYIASKLRNYDSRTRAIVEHQISNILFEADMGKLDNASSKRNCTISIPFDTPQDE